MMKHCFGSAVFSIHPRHKLANRRVCFDSNPFPKMSKSCKALLL